MCVSHAHICEKQWVVSGEDEGVVDMLVKMDELCFTYGVSFCRPNASALVA